jgi:hypothetical protein
MGRCGSSCVGAWAGGWDCLKHDVGSYFNKALAMETPVVGFCRGFDCGDETAQSVPNCWSRSSSSSTSSTTNDENISVVLLWFAVQIVVIWCSIQPHDFEVKNELGH